MKILMATHHFPPRHTGGVEWITLHAARWLQSHGHAVEVVCVEEILPTASGEVQVKVDEDLGVKVYRLSIPSPFETGNFHQRYWNESIGAWFSGFFEKDRPDLVHLHSGYLLTVSPLATAQELHIPTVISLHDYWTICPRIQLLHPDGTRCAGPSPEHCAWCLRTEQRRYREPDRLSGGLLGRWMEKPAAARLLGGSSVQRIKERQSTIMQVLQRCSAILAHARLARDLVLQTGVEGGRVLLSPYGLDISAWPDPLPPKNESITLRIGYLGNLIPTKGADVLVKAFRFLKTPRPVELRIYGDLEKDPAFGNKLQQLAGGDERIHFLGRYENTRVPYLMQDIDVLVVPSLWNETGPLVTLEGLACRTPVVVSDIPNMVHQVRAEEDGLVFQTGNAVSLVGQLERLAGEPELLERLRNGIQPVRSLDEQMQDWLVAYNLAVEKTR